MASTMHAVVIDTPGGPEALEVRELPRPIPSSKEVLIRVTAYSGEAKDLPPEVLQELLAYGTASPPPLTAYRGLEEARLAHEDMDHSRPGKKVVRVLHENGAES
ncbi:hypothetical protein FBF34_03595 [Arachnia propionica]|uniref:Alcohol dehydrogenase n=1 Tax=Arachnia propionica TaxID=1750 RepID=A0AB37I3A0_9ACTN|nr:zinc-dependent alcohol dehydrogenase [Arachnia propionica]AFN45232.1 alcohol dehydrogenase, zinc-dependent [Arachnia propionica F0230a]QCT37162.1 hypothetical protein FBF34_03595 [Arachnia propionica]QUC10499.1 hypothetical protein J5A53_12030 [Arachnia propionica]RPA17391.1 hypothetical protein EGT56_04990 [Arachnia propionica]